MGESEKGLLKPWMIDLANKCEVSPETVKLFYDTVKGSNKPGQSPRSKTVAFFLMYNDGVKH